MEGAVYLDAEFTAPWCVQARHGLSSVKRRLAGAEHVVFFHFFVQGGCKVALEDGKELAIHEGDLVIFPRDDHQRMGSDLRLVPKEAVTFKREESESSGCLIRIRHGGGGEATRMVCGFLASAPGVSQRLFAALPRVVRIPIGDGHASRLLRELIEVGVAESAAERWGAESMLAKLSELMFVEALRRY